MGDGSVHEATRAGPAEPVGDTGTIALIGFGEAAQALAAGWGTSRAVRLAAYDIKTERPATHDAMVERMTQAGVAGSTTPRDAVAGAAIVFSLVTADQALAAARAAAPHLAAGALWLDCNSCAPGTKRQAAQAVEEAGGHYVDVAVMAPIHPKLHRTPMLVSGPAAAVAKARMDALGMDVRLVGDEVGRASAIKMLRSVMVKGIEAISAECLLAARRAGVEGEVLASLQASDPQWDWRARSAYQLERMMVHGERRAAEMREVAKTLHDLGLPARLSEAVADWQQEIGELHLTGAAGDLEAQIDRIDAAINAASGKSGQ